MRTILASHFLHPHQLLRAPLRRLPPAAWGILREAARHLLRRPVVAVVGVARLADGRWLLVKRGDFGNWGLPGGTLEWGETLVTGLQREMFEEAGARIVKVGRLVGVFSDPNRDIRFHSVTIAIECEVSLPVQQPVNPLEVLDVGLFTDADLPTDLAFGCGDAIAAARSGAAPIIE
jgi:8-oxo-dGTP diphosphatase